MYLKTTARWPMSLTRSNTRLPDWKTESKHLKQTQPIYILFDVIENIANFFYFKSISSILFNVCLIDIIHIKWFKYISAGEIIYCMYVYNSLSVFSFRSYVALLVWKGMCNDVRTYCGVQGFSLFFSLRALQNHSERKWKSI